MLDTELLASIANQLRASDTVELDGTRLHVRRLGHQRLKSMSLSIDRHEYQAIEQNPEKPSTWGQLARSGHQVVQFKDVGINRFVAVAVDGEITVYGSGGPRNDEINKVSILPTAAKLT